MTVRQNAPSFVIIYLSPERTIALGEVVKVNTALRVGTRNYDTFESLILVQVLKWFQEFWSHLRTCTWSVLLLS
jgi:hypothetical protein